MLAAAPHAGVFPANNTHTAPMGSALAPPKTSREALSPLMVSVISFLVINTLIVVARAVSRLYLAKLSFWWDDLCILVGYVVLVAMGAVILVVVRVEVDYSPLDALVADLAVMETLAKLIYAYLLLLTASFAATRLAILALYLRIFQAKRLRRIIWAVVTLVALQYIAFTLVTIFACWPVYKFWTPTPHNEGTCINRGTFLRTMTPFNIAIDAVLVILPLPTVWQLKATRFRKWALTFVFGLGIIALVVSAIRLATIDSNPIGVRTSPSNTNALFLWVYVEPSVYLVAACLPTMHHIIAAATPHLISSWLAKKLSWLSRLGKSSGKTSLGSEPNHNAAPCGAEDFNPYVGNDVDLEALGQEAKVEATELHVVENGGRRLSRIEGIMVTQEVKVTHEDRIASVIGF